MSGGRAATQGCPSERQSAAADARSTTPTAIPRVTLTKREAAQAVGVSLDHFERHVLPDLRVIRCGRRVLVRPAELRRWAEESEAFRLVGEST
jgi:hypothetical protein